ncbi:MAG: FixH family protein, partial [Bdellovibrionales bacterium]|nr:FixH family protein [Bdellovibrionales bacterium]
AFGSSIYFVVIALQSDNGVVTKTAYEDSLKYEGVLEKLRASKRLGWKVGVKTDSRVLSVSLADSVDAPITDAKIAVRALYPADQALDLNGALHPTNHPGDYQLEIQLPAPGVWLIEISALRGEQEYLWKDQIVVR